MPYLGHKESAFWFYWGLIVLGAVTIITYRKDPVSMIAGIAALGIGIVMLLLPPLRKGGWSLTRFGVLATAIVTAAAAVAALWQRRSWDLVASLAVTSLVLFVFYCLTSHRFLRRRIPISQKYRTSPASRPDPGKILSVTAYTSHLSHLYNSTHELLTAGFAKKEFALLNVRNTSTRNLGQVVARCYFQGDAEDFCIWSLKTGNPPFEPGTHEADLSAGNSRSLVIARGFGDEELWARLPPEGEPFHLISRVHIVSREDGKYEDEIQLVSSSGSVRGLPKEIPITVTFQAVDLYQEERFTLGFKDGKPTITPASAAHIPTSASDPHAMIRTLAARPAGEQKTSNEEERLRVVLRKLSVEALQELTQLLEGPKQLHLSFGIIELDNSKLIERIGPGTHMLESVYKLNPEARDAVGEYLRERASRKKDGHK